MQEQQQRQQHTPQHHNRNTSHPWRQELAKPSNRESTTLVPTQEMNASQRNTSTIQHRNEQHEPPNHDQNVRHAWQPPKPLSNGVAVVTPSPTQEKQNATQQRRNASPPTRRRQNQVMDRRRYLKQKVKAQQQILKSQNISPQTPNQIQQSRQKSLQQSPHTLNTTVTSHTTYSPSSYPSSASYHYQKNRTTNTVKQASQLGTQPQKSLHESHDQRFQQSPQPNQRAQKSPPQQSPNPTLNTTATTHATDSPSSYPSSASYHYQTNRSTNPKQTSHSRLKTRPKPDPQFIIFLTGDAHSLSLPLLILSWLLLSSSIRSCSSISSTL